MGRRDSVEAKRAYNRERYWRDRERILAQQREHYAAHREELLSKDQEYYRANKDKIKARAARHYQENAEKVKAREAKRRYDRKSTLVAILGGKCRDCPMTHPAALDFHHRDPNEKLFSIGDMLMTTRKIPEEMMLTEVQKCDLLCKNCHAIEHCTWTPEMMTTDG